MAIFITLTPGNNVGKLQSAIIAAMRQGILNSWEFDVNTGFTYKEIMNNREQWNQGGYLAYGKFTKTAANHVKLYFRKIDKSKLTPNTYNTLNKQFTDVLINHFKEFIASIQFVDLRKA